MDARLLRSAVEVNWQNLALGHSVTETAGATFVRNRALPQIYDANFIFAVTVSEPDEISALLARAALEYTDAAQVTFRTDPFTPPAFEARLLLDGYEKNDALLLLLDGPLLGEPRRFDIQPIEDDRSWMAYGDLKQLDWKEHAARTNENPEDEAIPRGLASSTRLKCPPVQYLMAYEAGQPVGHCSFWEGRDGVGQVEDLFVHPAYRHRGVATALLHACVAETRARGTRPIVIVTDPTDSPKDMYLALGWRPIAVCRQYGKKNISSGRLTD